MEAHQVVGDALHPEHGQAVGAFEGASYEARGLYRPRADCIMFSRNPVGFCPVCQRGLTRVIDLYSRTQRNSSGRIAATETSRATAVAARHASAPIMWFTRSGFSGSIHIPAR
mgnify:CR=1 FL=1